MATLIDAFQSWRRDLEAVEREMDQLIAAGLPASVEERQVRQARFVTLVERREAAARKLLQFDWIGRRNKGLHCPSLTLLRQLKEMPKPYLKRKPSLTVAISLCFLPLLFRLTSFHSPLTL